MPSAYRILDEPEPTTLTRFSVKPFWILLGLMLGGAWLGWPWFVLNAVAFGSSTRKRELALCAAGLLGSAVLAAGLLVAFERGLLSEAMLPYAGTALILWKLGVGYFIYAAQSVSFELYEYFGGVSRNAIGVVILASLARQALVAALDSAFWILVLV